MKKRLMEVMMVVILILGGSLISMANVANEKPPRPEKIEEVKSAQPSEYHTWVSGRWKWKKKEQSWLWREGYWKFDHDLYAFKNRYRFGNYAYYNYYRPRYWRYALVPLGRGYYRVVRY
ncbi:MAG: BcpO-related WXXGXW repeat protein [Saprospiraceae bacterium]|nr:BcpO-related WXXGXW repeat protein [Saprospiraceae bacterium]